jgi:hypothetical protein
MMNHDLHNAEYKQNHVCDMQSHNVCDDDLQFTTTTSTPSSPSSKLSHLHNLDLILHLVLQAFCGQCIITTHIAREQQALRSSNS